jgi:DNA invertase Pin-like site-specific DNA recombinase
MDDEQWRPAFGFEGRYLVSNLGQAARIVTRRGEELRRVMNGRKEGNGYITFHFYGADGKQKHPLAHRAVWQAFNGEIERGLEINHKNGDKSDNRLANLELATRSENMLHGFRELNFSRNRLKGEHHPKANLRDEDVPKILQRRSSGVRRSIVAAEFGISSTTVRLIETGQNWGHLTGIPENSGPIFNSPSCQGSGNGNAKLREEDIPKIIKMRRSGLSQSKIANEFGVAQATIWRVLTGKRWSHISGGSDQISATLANHPVKAREPKKPIQCAGCGKRFTPQRPPARYCSARCRVAAHPRSLLYPRGRFC